MIKIYDYKGSVHYVSPLNLAKITEAGVSGQWHGIKCHVKLFDGTVIESRDSADSIAAQVAEQAS